MYEVEINEIKSVQNSQLVMLPTLHLKDAAKSD